MTMDYEYIEVNDATYAYTRQGQGAPLVLFHGFTGTSETWRAFIDQWQTDYEVIAIDLPGHGSTKTKTAKTLENFAQDFKQILAELHIEQVHLLGYSMGGRMALALTIAYPEIVRSLILESASPGIESTLEREVRRLADERLAGEIMKEGITHFVNYWENIPMFASQKKLPINTQQAIRRERLSQTEVGLSQSLLHMGTGKQASYWDKLHTLCVPVLLIVGEDDKKFVEMNEKMVPLIKDVKIITVPEAGHAVHVEQVDYFTNLVCQFIAKIT